MTTKWFYKHAGHVLGPYNADEMRLLAAIGLVRPDDRLWPEGGGRHDVIEARSAIDFAALPPPRLSPPEWLADVEQLESHGPHKIEWPVAGTPRLGG